MKQSDKPKSSPKKTKPISDTKKTNPELYKDVEDLLNNILVEVREELRDCDEENLKMLNAKISEYLSTYVIIGYGLDDKCITFTKTNTRKDVDSLATAVNRFITTSDLLDNLDGIPGTDKQIFREDDEEDDLAD